MEAKFESFISGRIPEVRSETEKREERILNIINSKENLNLDEFLRGLSRNVNF